MNEENIPDYSKTSIKSKVLVSFVLIIFILGIGISSITMRVLNQSLIKAQIDPHIINEISRNFTVVSSGLVIVSITLSIIAAVYLSKYLTMPINELRVAVEKMDKSSFEIKIDPKLEYSEDEVGQLARSFIMISTELKNFYKSLEMKVAERTKELELAKKILEEKIDESNRMNKLMIGRESRMIELKDEIEELKKKLG
ncbi:MAG: hypothetical protein WAV98_03300 [Minisyncoccia bacterium]